MDFSILTDDQLVELIKAACAEASRRGTATEAAAKHAMLTEAEKAQIARMAIEREAEKLRELEARRVAEAAAEELREKTEAQVRADEAKKQQKLWALKKDLAVQVIALLGKNQKLTVWERDGDKRVYIDDTSDQAKISYFHTGNAYNPPGSLVFSKWNDTPERRIEALEICKKACKDWKKVSFYCDEAAAADVEVSS